MTDAETMLQNLSTRGITTLEQFAERQARIRKPQRIDSEKALQEVLARLPPPDPSFKSKVKPPAPSVALVLDGKRVDYSAIARLDGKPLDYVATTLKGGQQALVIFSDRSIMRNHRLQQFKGAFRAFSEDVEKALMAGGLQPAPFARGIDLGGRYFENHFYDFDGDYGTVAPNDYVPDLTELADGLFSDWNDKISSIQMGRCTFQGWEDINEGGSTLKLYQDTPELDSIGWNDIISGFWFPFSN